MKKILVYLLLIFVLISCCFASPSQKAFAASMSDNAVIILSGNVNQENKLVIQANLTVNTGISGMTLELSYDKNAMVLSNVEIGSALSSLEPITTNTQTSEGFAITPFKFNYLGQENDFSTGNLFTLTFDLQENVKDGNYVVSLKYEKNSDVSYYDIDGIKTKNLYIDKAEVQIKNNSVEQVVSIADDSQKSKTLIVVLIVAIPLAVGSIVFVAIKFLKRQRNWEKL